MPRCLAPAPVPLGRRFASCVWRNSLYVSGGDHAPHSFLAYRPWLNQWERLCDLPFQRQGHCMVAVDNAVYALGGRGGAGETVDSVLAYKIPRVGDREAGAGARVGDMVTGAGAGAGAGAGCGARVGVWLYSQTLKEGVHSACAAVLGTVIFVFGGVCWDG